MSRSNYVAAILRHLQATGTTPGVHHIEARHDDDCGAWQGGRCDCEPEVETGRRIDAKYRKRYRPRRRGQK